MNNYFKGSTWSLGERYTDLLKTLFVALFYSSVLPTGLLITTLSCLVNYWVDKYCLLRVWARVPLLDGQVRPPLACEDCRRPARCSPLSSQACVVLLFVRWITALSPLPFLTLYRTDRGPPRPAAGSR